MSDKNFGSENYIKSTEILPEFDKKIIMHSQYSEG
jgi:hypothetical protein